MKFSNTNLNLYRTFVTLYEEGTMPKAAALLGISQQAVAHNIKVLSEQLGIKLFSGTNRGVKATAEASALYKKIKPALDLILRAEEDIVDFGEQSEGELKIVTTTNFTSMFLDKRIVKFRKKYPNIKFDIAMMPVATALEAMENGQVHFILSAIPLATDKDFKFNQVELERYKQSFGTTPEFAKANKIGKTISQEKFNTLPFYAVRTIKHFVDNIKEPDVVSDSQDTLINLFTENIFVTFGVWTILQRLHGEDGVFLFNVEGVKPRDLSIVCAYPSKKSLTKAAEVFIEFLIEGIE